MVRWTLLSPLSSSSSLMMMMMMMVDGLVWVVGPAPSLFASLLLARLARPRLPNLVPV